MRNLAGRGIALVSLAMLGMALLGMGSISGGTFDLGAAPATALTQQALPAFPGAEGFGSTTPGGRGGQVIKVTNLNESGPGSFRAAVEASGARIVVFDVGGTIDMQGKPLAITNPYLTIAGQTAPGDGILLKGSDIAIKTHDVVIRGLRIRVGDSGTDSSNTSEQRGILMGTEEAYNIVIDHCSISWGRGGNLYAFRGAHDITFSWNIVAEALKLEGSKGITHHRTTTGGISTHHNVIVSNRIRNPEAFAPRNDVVNNLVYNYGTEGASIWLPPGRTANVIGNVYLPGPDTNVNGTLKGIYVTYSQDPRTGEIGTAPATLYLERNLGPGREQIISPVLDLNEEWQAVYADSGVTMEVLVSTPFEQNVITVHSPETLQELLLGSEGAGAIVPSRDAVDERIIHSIYTNSGRIILSQNEVGGWPAMQGGTPPPDSDDDGMPDDWEIAHGLNPNAYDANGKDLSPEGYDNIEVYINSLIPLPGDAPTPTPTITPTASPTPTPSPTPPASQCVRDVNANGIGDAVDVQATAADLNCYVYLPVVAAQWRQPWPSDTSTPTATATTADGGPPTATATPTATPTRTPTPTATSETGTPTPWTFEATVFDSSDDPGDANLSRPEFCIFGNRAYVTFRRTVTGNGPGAPATQIVLKVFDVNANGDWTDITGGLFPDNPHVLYGPSDPHNVGAFTDHQLLCGGNAFFLVFEANFTEGDQKMGHTVVRRYNPDWSYRNQVTLLETPKGPGVQRYKTDDPGVAWLNGTLFVWVVRLQGGLGTPATGFALYGLDPTTLEVTVDDGAGGPRLLENPLQAPFPGVMDFIDGEYRLLSSPREQGGSPYDQDGLVEYRYDPTSWTLVGSSVAPHPFGDDRPTYATSRLRYGAGMQAWGFTVVPAGRDQADGAIGRAWVRLADADGRAAYFPVSDRDDTRHTEIVVHNGKAYVAYFHVTEPRTTVIRRYDLPDEQVIPPLYVFYVNHTHLAGDWWPYTDNSMTTIDPTVAANFSAAIRGIARVMDRYGARASWEVVYGAAQGLCTYEGDNHVFRRLLEAGHEVGLHVHNHAHYARDYGALHDADACGLDPTVTSGLIVGTANLPDEEAHARVAAAIRTNLGFGVQVGTINMSRNAFMARCDGRIGEGNDMWAQTGNLMFPWRPKYSEPDICADDPNGDFVLVDHVDMARWTGRAGNQQTDLFSREDFERLRALFDAALNYMEENRPDRVAAWGFVTHVHEFMPGSQGENPPDEETLALFDAFWSYVAQQAAAGRVIFVTAGEIAEAAFP